MLAWVLQLLAHQLEVAPSIVYPITRTKMTNTAVEVMTSHKNKIFH